MDLLVQTITFQPFHADLIVNVFLFCPQRLYRLLYFHRRSSSHLGLDLFYLFIKLPTFILLSKEPFWPFDS